MGNAADDIGRPLRFARRGGDQWPSVDSYSRQRLARACTPCAKFRFAPWTHAMRREVLRLRRENRHVAMTRRHDYRRDLARQQSGQLGCVRAKHRVH
jgi:hypothetical protein